MNIFDLPKPSRLTFKSFGNLPEYIFSKVLNRVNDPLDKRRVVISINMAFAQIAIYLALFFFATLKGYNSESTYYTLISAGMISLMLLATYRGHPKFGMSFGLILSCISMILIAKRAGPDSGADHYYVLLGVVPFVFFGYRDRYFAIGLLAFSSICFLITRTIEFNFIEPMLLTPQQAQVFLIINTIFTAGLTAYALLNILTINQMAEREMLQKQLIAEQQNEELKRVNAELDKFVYSASHDLSAPLKSIGGLINITKMEDPPSTIRQYLDLMQKSVARLESFIRDIVNYSRNSRLPIKHEIVDISSLVRSIWEDHLYYTNQPSKIELQLENSISSSFFSDETRLRIIFNNLLSNAIKFHLEEKREQPFVRVVAQEDYKGYFFEIADNGRGMNAEVKENIFKMFFRGNSGISGSGLGLYILKESVEKLNGTVEVESELDKGSSFKIRIPKNGKSLV